MAIWVQYFHQTTDGNYIEACGDRGIVRLDARNSRATQHRDAESFNGWHRPHYDAYQLIGGHSLLAANPISGVIALTTTEEKP